MPGRNRLQLLTKGDAEGLRRRQQVALIALALLLKPFAPVVGSQLRQELLAGGREAAKFFGHMPLLPFPLPIQYMDACRLGNRAGWANNRFPGSAVQGATISIVPSATFASGQGNPARIPGRRALQIRQTVQAGVDLIATWRQIFRQG